MGLIRLQLLEGRRDVGWMNAAILVIDTVKLVQEIRASVPGFSVGPLDEHLA